MLLCLPPAPLPLWRSTAGLGSGTGGRRLDLLHRQDVDVRRSVARHRVRRLLARIAAAAVGGIVPAGGGGGMVIVMMPPSTATTTATTPGRGEIVRIPVVGGHHPGGGEDLLEHPDGLAGRPGGGEGGDVPQLGGEAPAQREALRRIRQRVMFVSTVS